MKRMTTKAVPTSFDRLVALAQTVTLEGAQEGKVPIYDTCDEVRKKIMKFQTDSGCPSVAALLRVLSPEKEMQSAQWNRFIGVRGKNEGNSQLLYYVAYVFLEKLRVAQAAPKDNSRLKNEEVLARLGSFGRNGFSRAICTGYLVMN